MRIRRFVPILASGLLIGTQGITLAGEKQAVPPPKTNAVTSYAQARTLGDALFLVRQELWYEGKKQYFPLLSETAMRQAIRAALAAYEKNPRALAPAASEEQLREVFVPHFQKVAPLYRQIAETGKWPQGAYFGAFYTLGGDSGSSYQGLGLRLMVDRASGPYSGFSLPVLDVWYGKPEK